MSLRSTLSACLPLLLLCSPLVAAGSDLSGRWEGTAAIPGTAPMAMIIDIARDAGGGWTGSVVLPGRGVKGAPLGELRVQGDSLSASLAAAIPSFGAPGAPPGVRLALQADGSLGGDFSQAGHRAPLQLRRSGDAQPDLPVASTPLAAMLGGTWRGAYQLGGHPRQVTLVLKPGNPAAAELTIVGRRTTQVTIDRIVQGPRFVTFESTTMGLLIEGRYSAAQISGHLQQGPFEAPLLLTRTATVQGAQ